nr:hypothetical protein [Brevibacillus laterosporus]
MKLWEVTNGFMGYSYCHVIAIADTEERAKELASEKFKERASSENERFWTNLEVECLGDATTELVIDRCD